MIAALAWRNIWRQPRRTLLSVLGIAFTSALLIFQLSFVLGFNASMESTLLHIFDGYAQLRPPGYADDPDTRRTIAEPEKVVAELRKIPGIGAATPRVVTFGIVANGDRSYGSAVIGVDPVNEPLVSTLAGTVHSGRFLKRGETDGAVIGEVLARNLKLHLGDRITLLGSGIDGSVAADVLHVVGIFRTNLADLDRQTLEMPLARAQSDFSLGDRANIIAVSGPTLPGVTAAMPQISAVAAQHGVTAANWVDLEPSVKETAMLKLIDISIISTTLVVVVVFIILNTLLMSVLERTREFGTLLALGIRPRVIGAVIWLELVMLALVGDAIGIAIGGGLSAWLAHTGFTIPGIHDVLVQFALPERFYTEFNLQNTLIAPTAIFVSILIAGLVPYLRILRLEPVSAMRAV